MLTKDNAAISDFPNFLKEIILVGFLALYKYKYKLTTNKMHLFF